MQIRDNTTDTATTDLEPLFRMHAELCKALANEHRQALLHALGDGEKCVGDLAAEIGISVHNVSQHLRVLKERRMVASRKAGQTVYYHVTNQKFLQACALMAWMLEHGRYPEGESLQAAELLDEAPAPAVQPATTSAPATDSATAAAAPAPSSGSVATAASA